MKQRIKDTLVVLVAYMRDVSGIEQFLRFRKGFIRVIRTSIANQPAHCVHRMMYDIIRT